jgi:hypothetical protein
MLRSFIYDLENIYYIVYVSFFLYETLNLCKRMKYYCLNYY